MVAALRRQWRYGLPPRRWPPPSRPGTSSISAGDLAHALNAFARQANQEIIFSSTLVAGKRTRAFTAAWNPAPPC